VLICLVTLVLVPWNVLTPLAPIQSNFWNTKVRFKPPFFYKASMITIVRLSTLAPSTTFWRKNKMGTLIQFCITYVGMEIQLPLLHSAHLITCKGHIISNGNNGQNNFNHLDIHKFCHYPTWTIRLMHFEARSWHGWVDQNPT